MLVSLCIWKKGPAEWRCCLSSLACNTTVTLENILSHVTEFTCSCYFEGFIFVLSIRNILEPRIFRCKWLSSQYFCWNYHNLNVQTSLLCPNDRVSITSSWCSLKPVNVISEHESEFFPKKMSKLGDDWKIFIIKMSRCHLGSLQPWWMWALAKGNCLQFSLCFIIAATQTPNMFQNHAHLILLCYTVQNAAVQFKMPP